MVDQADRQDEKLRDTECAPGVRVNDSRATETRDLPGGGTMTAATGPGVVLLGVAHFLTRCGHAVAQLTPEQARNVASALLQAAARVDHVGAGPALAAPRTDEERILFESVQGATRKAITLSPKIHEEGPGEAGGFNLALRAAAETLGLAVGAFRTGASVGAALALASKRAR